MAEFEGSTFFKEKKVWFTIDSYILTLYLDQETAIDIVFEKAEDGALEYKVMPKPLYIDSLICFTNDGRYKIHCYFNKEKYERDPFLFKYTSSVPIRIPLRYLVILKLTDKSDSVYMSYLSNKFNIFTNLLPKFENVSSALNNKNVECQLNCDVSSVQETANFIIGKYKGTMHPEYSLYLKEDKYEFNPMLTLDFDGKIDEQDIEKIYVKLLWFVQYCFMRKDIYPDKLYFSNGEFEGEIRENYSQYLVEKEHYNEEDLKISFPWTVFYKHAGELFNLIYEGKLYLYNISSNVNGRSLVTIESISKDAAAFEKEFNEIFGKTYDINEKKEKARSEVLSELNNLKDNSTGYKKNIYKYLEKRVKIESLYSKMQYALDYYENYIKTVKKRLKINYSNEIVSANCSMIRNDVDHGNNLEEITKEVGLSFILLKSLIYAMQLSRANFSVDEIDTLVDSIFRTKSFPPL